MRHTSLLGVLCTLLLVYDTHSFSIYGTWCILKNGKHSKAAVSERLLEQNKIEYRAFAAMVRAQCGFLGLFGRENLLPRT